MESLHYNYTEIWRHCKIKRRNQNKEFSFPFFVGSSPDPSTEEGVVRKNSLFLVPSEARQRGAQNHHAIRAYERVQSHHARGACEDQSLRDCSKWVRAKCSNSSQNRTSRSESAPARRSRAEQAGKIPRRFATNWDGTGAPKRADLSLVSYLKAT